MSERTAGFCFGKLLPWYCIGISLAFIIDTVMCASSTHINQLQRFHISTLRRIQSLPERTASSAVQLLLGTLTIQAELHKRQVSLLHSIVRSGNVRLKSILGVGLITPGHPRIPQDTPGHPRIPQDAFNFLHNSFIYSLIYSFRRKQSENGI